MKSDRTLLCLLVFVTIAEAVIPHVEEDLLATEWDAWKKLHGKASNRYC